MGKIILPSKHPTLASSSDITEICRPLFEKLKLNYFQFKKVHRDGSISVLCNRADWIDFSLKQDIGRKAYSCEKKEISNSQSYYFLWEPNLPSAPIALAREFDIANGLCFVERHPDFYYLIAFATPVSNQQALDLYLNHLELLKNFIHYFRETKADLIKVADSNRIILSAEEQDLNVDAMLLSSNLRRKVPVFFQGKYFHITQREYDCLQAMNLGNTGSDIALMLNLSPRTVETYLQRIKDRVGVRSKQELLSLLAG